MIQSTLHLQLPNLSLFLFWQILKGQSLRQRGPAGKQEATQDSERHQKEQRQKPKKRILHRLRGEEGNYWTNWTGVFPSGRREFQPLENESRVETCSRECPSAKHQSREFECEERLSNTILGILFRVLWKTFLQMITRNTGSCKDRHNKRKSQKRLSGALEKRDFKGN